MQAANRYDFLPHLTHLGLGLIAALGLAQGHPVAAQGGLICGVHGWGHLPRWVPPGTGAFHQVGRSVDIDEHTAVVGAPGGDVVHVYEREGSTWSLLQSLPDPNGSGNDFGQAVKVQGDLLVVGSPDDGSDANLGGVAHVYQRSGGSWAHLAVLHDPTPSEFGSFGTDVDLAGDWIGAGAPGDEAGGSVHLFFRSGAAVQHEAQIESGASDDFGFALAMAEDGATGVLRLIVGDYGDNVAGVDAGMVRAYNVTLDSVSGGFAYRPPGLQGGDYFGVSLDTDGQHVIVGAYGDDSFGINDGSAYVLNLGDFFQAPVLSLEQVLYGCASDSGDNFGRTVAIDGGRAAVGAPNDEELSSPGGRAYVFELDPVSATWEFEDTLWAADAALDDEFGWDVALDGDAVLVGARSADTPANSGGAAYYASLSSSWFPGGQLPSEHLATFQTQFKGKPGTMGLPSLSTADLPLPGDLHVLRAQNGLPGATPFLFYGLVPALIPFDEGNLFIGDPQILVLPAFDPWGTSPFSWTPPVGVGGQGVEVLLQVMFVDPFAAGALQTAQTNLLRLTIGY